MDQVKRKCSTKKKKNNGNNNDDDDDAYLIDYSALMNLPKSIILEAIEYAKRKRDEEDSKEKDENQYIRLKCIPPWAKTYGGKRIESCLSVGTQYEIEEIGSSISEIRKTDIDESKDLEESEKISEEKRSDKYEGGIKDTGEEIITDLVTDETEQTAVEEAEAKTDIGEEKPTTEAELEEEKPTKEVELEEQKPTEVELEEETPATEIELEEEKPTTEIEAEEEKPTAEFEAEEEKPTEEFEAEEEKPTVEFEAEEEKPTAEFEAEEEKPTAEFETKEKRLLEAEKLDSEVETKEKAKEEELETEEKLETKEEEPEIEQILEIDDKDLKSEESEKVILEKGEEESLEELAKYEETKAVMEELKLEGKQMKRTKETPDICIAEEAEAELTEELSTESEERHESFLDELDKEEVEEDKIKVKQGKDSEYIKKELGNILVKALAEIAWRRPHDPVHFLAHRLYHEYKQKQILEEEIRAIKILEGEKQRLQVAGDISIKSFGYVETSSSLPAVELSLKDESYETSEEEKEIESTVYKKMIDSPEEISQEITEEEIKN